MAKRRKQKRMSNVDRDQVARNPVARFAHQFNRCKVYRDKSKYDRKAHKKSFEPFVMGILEISITKGLLA